MVLDLQEPGGTPVETPAGDPVTATTDSHGAFTFPEVVDGTYVIAVDPPARTTITGATEATVVVDVTTGSVAVPAGTFAVHVTPRATPTPTAAPTVAAVAAGPTLPATGSDTAPLTVIAVALLLVGAAVRRAGRRRAH